MYYKAKNVDTDKALDAINEARRIQEHHIAMEKARIEAKMEGIYKGLSIAESIFECSNYEKDVQPKESTYIDGVLDVIYEIGKELDVSTQDLRENMTSIDETVCELADRIKARFAEMEKLEEMEEKALRVQNYDVSFYATGQIHKAIEILKEVGGLDV